MEGFGHFEYSKLRSHVAKYVDTFWLEHTKMKIFSIFINK